MIGESYKVKTGREQKMAYIDLSYDMDELVQKYTFVASPFETGPLAVFLERLRVQLATADMTGRNNIDEMVMEAASHMMFSSCRPKRIIRNGPATIVFWHDGTKTVVKCHDEDYDPEKGLAMALARKLWGRSRTGRFVRMVEEQ